MKGWTKRRVALILALAMLASQMSGCKDNANAANNSASVSNSNSIVAETEEPNMEEAETDADGWLEEKLENIHQSLLSGDYAQVVDLLLGMQDELENNAQYNALLYIAYMGNGNENEAAALLTNPNLDTNDFTDAFLEATDALQGNPDIAAIERKLMEHMLGLGETNPEAYEAVARIGANIQNDDPTDPTAYAARYIAALAAGDEAAAKAILAEAEANGVSAEALQTTAIEYIEEHNLTMISVEEIEKGKATTTTYSGSGNVVRVDETVTKPDGSKTEYAKDKDGVVYGVAQYGADGKIASRTVYHYEMVVNQETGRMERKLAQVEEQSYSDGVISSLVLNNVTADGNTEPDFKLTFNEQGTISSYKVYEDGEEKPMSQGKINATEVDIVDGEIVATTFPVVDENDKVVGKVVSEYSYHHPAGVIEDRKECDLSGNVLMDADYSYSYESGYVENIDATAKFYDAQGNVEITARVDYANNKYEEIFADGTYQEAVMDVTDKYLLTQEVYNDQGVLTERRYAYYTGTTMTSELDVHYDADGRVIKEVFYGEDREIDLDNPKSEITYEYIDGMKLKTKTEYDPTGITLSIEETTYLYEYNYQETLVYDYVNYEITGHSSQTFTNSDGSILGTIYKEYDWLTDTWVQNKQDQYTYNEDGTVKKIDVYSVENGNGTKSHEISYTYNEDGSKTVENKNLATGTSTVTEYTYTENGETLSESVYEVDTDNNRVDVSVKDYSYDENGAMTGYVISAKDADGNIKETHYNAEGYAYEIAVYDTAGQLLMVMRLDSETVGEGESVPEETIPEETIPEETVPEETVPEETVPEETIPEETVPEETVPEETIPEETIPEETIPEETVPEETIPEETVPKETIPEETVPEETSSEETIPGETIPEEIVSETTAE